MKIAFNALGLYPDHKGGAESVFYNLVKGFVMHGISQEITYFCYEEIEENIRLLSPESTIIVIKHLPQKHISRLDMLLTQSFEFHKIYKKHNFDIIIFANADVGLFPYNLPTIVIPHDIQFVSNPKKNKNIFQYLKNYYSYKIAFGIADKIIAISDADKNEIESCYPFTRSKTVKIYDPINISKEDINIRVSKSNHILAVNIQYPHKNISTLLRAFSDICYNHNDLSLQLVGAENEHTESLKRLADSLGISNRVVFLGFIPREKLKELWESARLYVNPSLYEGFGMTAVESLIYGSPTLLGDLDVNREVTDNLASYYSKIDDPVALAEAIESLLSIEFDYESHLKTANQLVEKYCIRNISQQYINLIQSMLVQND